MRFSEITGHEEAKATLREMVKSGEVPHALLFSGPEGIGKLALARAFAAYLQCENRTPEGDSCGTCRVCRQHATLNFPDLNFVYPTVGSKGSSPLLSEDYAEAWREFTADAYPASFTTWTEMIKGEGGAPAIKVDEATEILRKMTLSSYSSDYKVMIIWRPELLNKEAANRLLKLIEEPPTGSIFLLVSNAPQDILPTIFSRSRQLLLRPLAEEDVRKELMARGIDEFKAAEASKGAAGSILKALETARDSEERALFFELFTRLMRLAWKRDVAALREWSEEAAKMKREKTRRFFIYAALMVREAFICNLADDRLMGTTAEEKRFAIPFSPYVNVANVEDIAKEFSEADADAAANANLRILLFDLAVRLIILIRRKPQAI